MTTIRSGAAAVQKFNCACGAVQCSRAAFKALRAFFLHFVTKA